MKFKKIVVLFVITASLLVLAIPAFADSVGSGFVEVPDERYYAQYSAHLMSVKPKLLDRIEKAALSYQTTAIDISDLNIPYPNTKFLQECFEEVSSLPEIFHMYSYSYYYSSEKYLNVTIKYSTSSKAEWESLKKGIDAEYRNICSYLRDDMTQVEKMLAVYDYMAVNYEYDTENLEKGTVPYESYTSYGVMMKKIGVCQGYAEAYALVLNRLGYECIITSSDQMNHAWNMVKLGNNWYHVDVTWGDATPDRLGRVLHKYFLVSDATMSTVTDEKAGIDGYNYYGWVRHVYCNDKTYESPAVAPWLKSNSPVLFDATNMYIANKDGTIVSVNRKTGSSTQIYKLEDRWPAPGNRYYIDSFMSITSSGDRIYFNSPSEIRSIKKNGTDLRSHLSVGNGSIFAMKGNSSVIEYAVSADIGDGPVRAMYTYKIVSDFSIVLSSAAFKNGLGVGGNIELSRFISSGSAGGEVVWSVSNPDVAAFLDGKLYVKSLGEVTLTARSKDDPSVSSSVTLKVNFTYGDVDGNGVFNKDDLALMVGYFAGWNSCRSVCAGKEYRCDVDGVSGVSMSDMVLLARKLSGLTAY